VKLSANPHLLQLLFSPCFPFVFGISLAFVRASFLDLARWIDGWEMEFWLTTFDSGTPAAQTTM
jgi:hypothetical protein